MSMPVITKNPIPITAVQAAADLLESIALEETALSHILNAEGEKIQKVLEISCDPGQLLDVNDSVITTISTIAQLEEMLKNKLEIVLNHMCSCIGCEDNPNPPIPPVPPVPPVPPSSCGLCSGKEV